MSMPKPMAYAVVTSFGGGGQLNGKNGEFLVSSEGFVKVDGIEVC